MPSAETEDEPHVLTVTNTIVRTVSKGLFPSVPTLVCMADGLLPVITKYSNSVFDFPF